MSKLPRLIGLFVAIVLVTTACGGSATSAVEEAGEEIESAFETPTFADERPVEETPSPDPTPTEVIVEPDPTTPEQLGLSDEDKVAAAQSAFARDAGDLIAWDFVSSEVLGERVRLELCGWTGDRPSSSVYLAEFNVAEVPDSPPTTELLFDGEQPGECLNQEMVNSALAFVNKYDSFWRGVRTDPTSYATAEASQIMTTQFLPIAEDLVTDWTSAGVHWRGLPPAADFPQGTINEILWRESEHNNEATFEIVVCRDLGEDFGLYDGDALLNDFKETVFGTHIIQHLQMVHRNGDWRFNGGQSAVWSDCEPDRWVEIANEWTQGPTWNEFADA